MYFTNQEHEQNFERLIFKYRAYGSECRSACYVVAHPEIYRKVNWDSKEADSPVRWYFGEYVEEENLFRESDIVPLLSSAFQDLARAAVDFYNGRNNRFSLGSITNWDDDVYRVFVQALEIRRNRNILNIK